MRVLILSVYHPELVRGGSQQLCYELFQGLKATPGVEAILLSAIDPSFTSLFKSGARITGFDGRPDEYLYLSRAYDGWWHKSSDVGVREAFADFLELTQPEVIHFHHFLLFGVDLISLARRVLPHARIVFTFHEFLAICHAQGHMLRTVNEALCSRASNVRCHQCFPDYRPEDFFLKFLWMKSHFEKADAFTVPSRFMIETFVEWGLDRALLHHVVNGQENYAGERVHIPARARRNRFGFFGQLVDVKGVHILLDAVSLLRSEGFEDFFIEINGDNIDFASEARRTLLKTFMALEDSLQPERRRVRLNGSYQAEQIGERMARVDWCVVPSIWREAFGLVISEAWMFKRPVIASDIGGPGERIRDDVDGLLFPVGDARSLAEVIRRACTEPGLWDRLSAAVPPPPPRSEMILGYLGVYQARPSEPVRS